MDFSVIARAGITQLEFSALVGVSRVTVNLWCQGKMNPNKFINSKVAVVLEHMEAAVQHGALPLHNASAMNRPGLIKGAVRDAMARRHADECVSPPVAATS